jgi:uncharacterized membrane protein YoaK (UPF0700 family)
MKSRLAISLSWIGGYTNVVALLGLGTVVSHLTGTSTNFSVSLGQADFRQAAFFGFLILTFTMGAALSGFVTESAKRRGWRSKYILPMCLEAILLSLLCLHMNFYRDPKSGLALYEGAGLACMAMGLQNATITRVSGSVVRTTHLTGVFTDFGLEGVQYLFWLADRLRKVRPERAHRLWRVSSRQPDALRVLLLISIAGSFIFGAIAAAILFPRYPHVALLAPILFLAWIVFVDWRTPIADIRELDILNDPELRLQGIVSSLLPPEVVLYRASCASGRSMHRAPNFQLWIDRVPESCRIIVLAVGSLTRFDANAVLDLEDAVKRLHEEHRHLILAGITVHQFKSLDALGVARTMDTNNLCPDLEFAVARAISILEDLRRRPDPIAAPALT